MRRAASSPQEQWDIRLLCSRDSVVGHRLTGRLRQVTESELTAGYGNWRRADEAAVTAVSPCAQTLGIVPARQPRQPQAGICAHRLAHRNPIGAGLLYELVVAAALRSAVV